jgi:hypothetical protein
MPKSIDRLISWHVSRKLPCDSETSATTICLYFKRRKGKPCLRKNLPDPGFSIIRSTAIERHSSMKSRPTQVAIAV